jgi:hypothetical protein
MRTNTQVSGRASRRIYDRNKGTELNGTERNWTELNDRASKQANTRASERATDAFTYEGIKSNEQNRSERNGTEHGTEHGTEQLLHWKKTWKPQTPNQNKSVSSLPSPTNYTVMTKSNIVQWLKSIVIVTGLDTSKLGPMWTSFNGNIMTSG